ncbi:MAG: nucleotide sugar dehydrogenase [Candidatus Buchananbacteria bacterium]
METKICVVGLGYVGLPLACLLSKHYKVSGFDVNKKKIDELKSGIDLTGEVENLSNYQVEYSNDPAIIKQENFIIVAVPTPILEDKRPDLSLVIAASKIVGQNLQPGSIVVYESTVYPGCTQEDCLPIIEKESGLRLGTDFKIGYSPERVNPGDKVHTIDKIYKIVSGSDAEALAKIAKVYGSITNVHQASSIKVAEAAKVIENVQRDLNIALMNELAVIFDRLGIDTKEVIEAAGTKWNFHKYQPGLVGGHCIGVDPYYLTYKAMQVGYNPQVILAGRGINEFMTEFVASKLINARKVLVMGLTFKENVPDIRNSKAKDLIDKLRGKGMEVVGHDPLLENFKDVVSRFGIKMIDDFSAQEKFDAIVVFSPHEVFKTEKYSLDNLKNICNDDPILFDLKGFYKKTEAEKLGFKYQTL